MVAREPETLVRSIDGEDSRVIDRQAILGQHKLATPHRSSGALHRWNHDRETSTL